MSPIGITLLLSMALGFATAGLLVAAFQLIASAPASFRLLGQGGYRAVLSVPFLAFAAPMIIMRNTVRGRLIEHRHMAFVVAATLLAASWSMMSGRVIVRFLGF